MELPRYYELSDADSVCDSKHLRGDTKEPEDEQVSPTPFGGVTLIKTSHRSMSGSRINAQGSEGILYSSKRLSMNKLELYQGDFFAPNQGSSSQALPKPYATIGMFSVDYVHPGTDSVVKIPERSFLYTKHWYHIDRYFKVNGVEYRLGGSHFIGGKVYVTCLEDADGCEPLAVLQPSWRPRIQRIITINARAVQQGSLAAQSNHCLLANGQPTVLLDNVLIADFIFRRNRRRRQAKYSSGGGGC